MHPPTVIKIVHVVQGFNNFSGATTSSGHRAAAQVSQAAKNQRDCACLARVLFPQPKQSKRIMYGRQEALCSAGLEDCLRTTYILLLAELRQPCNTGCSWSAVLWHKLASRLSGSKKYGHRRNEKSILLAVATPLKVIQFHASCFSTKNCFFACHTYTSAFPQCTHASEQFLFVSCSSQQVEAKAKTQSS